MGCYFILLLLTITIPGESYIQDTNFECSQNDFKPKIHIFNDSVIQFDTKVYIVSQEFRNGGFVINCSSNQPVDWRFEGSIGNTVVNSERSMTYHWYDDDKGFTQSCYYSALIFHSVQDEITGRYVCFVKPKLSFNVRNHNGHSSELVLFSGLSALTLRNTTKTYDLNWLLILLKNQKYNNEQYSYKLPCARNHPSARLNVFYMESIFATPPIPKTEWIEEHNYSEQVGVSITVRLSKDQLPRIYKCEATLDNSFETLYINIPSYPVAIYWPDVNSLVYKLPTYNVFYCISRVPIRIFKNDELPTYLEPTTAGFVQHYINMGFNYTSAVKVVRRNDDLYGEIGEITCQDIETNGSDINWSWKYTWNGLTNKNDGRNQLNGNLKRADCKTSVDANETLVRYIKASTHAELSLKQNCLSLPTNEWNICNQPNSDLHPQDYQDKSGVYALLPKGISGAFQCITPDVFNDKEHYAVFSQTVNDQLGNVGNPEQDYIQFTSSYQSLQSLIVEDVIDATCISSEMYFYGASIWVILWNNSTRSRVPPSWIISDNVTKISTFYNRNSKIVLKSEEIAGITCAAVSIKKIKDNKRKTVVYPSPEYKYLHVTPKTPILSFLEITVIVLAVTVALVVLFGIILARRVRRRLRKHDLVYNKTIQNFFEGYDTQVKDEGNLCQQAESQPYDDSFEIHPDNLQIGWDSPLGTGAYGFVLSGTYLKGTIKTETIKVAIKTLKNDTDDAYLKALMSELKVMIYIGKHENLVSLIGAITSKLKQRELYLVLEYCKNGSLFKYLTNRRDNFTNNLPALSKQSLIEEQHGRLYCNLQYTSQYELTSVDLYKWSRQIISGMEYLVSKKVIHGDLATRNVLLDNSLVAKVSDFGLSRRLYEQYEYVKQSQEPLPWRWMALESLRSLTFSAESDVWAFGITLWEIFSLADTPYLGNTYSPEFMAMLEAGYRLPMPKNAPNQVYDIMVECWNSNPEQRPTFNDLVVAFDNILDIGISNNYENLNTK